MEDLQQAYQAYQQALYHLRDPKVYTKSTALSQARLMAFSGTQALVRHWYTVRPIRIPGTRRRSLLASDAHAA